MVDGRISVGHARLLAVPPAPRDPDRRAGRGVRGVVRGHRGQRRAGGGRRGGIAALDRGARSRRVAGHGDARVRSRSSPGIRHARRDRVDRPHPALDPPAPQVGSELRGEHAGQLLRPHDGGRPVTARSGRLARDGDPDRPARRPRPAGRLEAGLAAARGWALDRVDRR